MKRKKKRRLILVFFIFFLLVTGGATAYVMSLGGPPMETIKLAGDNLGKARNAEADEYARDLLREAEASYDEAMREWKLQNEKWFISRDYQKLTELVYTSAQKAEEAYEKSLAKKNNMHQDLASSLHEVEGKIKNYEKNYASLPLNSQARTDYSSAKMLYLESWHAYERGNYNNVGPKLEKSRELINRANGKAHGLLKDYFSSLPTWKRWANETVEWSRKNSSSAIVVDKFARKCYVYRNGKLSKTFEAELGPNWIGDKLHKGDKATPEGKYHITRKKNKRETKYYRALLIDYPNADDKSRYQKEVNSGRISKRTGIGSLIEIHGDGGRGMDWTDGCVALNNQDMDAVFSLVSVGTPVTIVGSLKSLEDVNGF